MMSRLFWKFFFAFWLAVLVAGLSIGLGVQLRHNAMQEQQQAAPIQISRHASALISVAESIGDYGGRDALSQFLLDQQAVAKQPLMAVNDNGQELLDREVSEHAIETARNFLSQEGWPRPVRQVQLEDGERYLLFIAQSEDMPSDMPRWEQRKRPPPTPSVMIIAWSLSGLIFSALLAWWFTQPIRHLRRAFLNFASGKLETRVGSAMGKRRDELAELGHQFDEMADRISQLIGAQRQLLHDVSHELRSPLARMQAAIGLAEQNPAQQAAVLERIEKESQRIDVLIGDLLNLSRIDTGVDNSHALETIDIAELVDEIVEDARIEAHRKQQQIQLHRPERIMATIRRNLFLSAVENILRNAVKYSPEKSLIVVELRYDANKLTIRVTDQGPGVAETALDKIFDPFYRASQSYAQQSSGLGLTIARRAVHAMNGSIEAHNHAQGGLEVIISLPV
ncbi:Osmosensitive K+ channel histidine kinase KdpD [Methylophaga lonarensis MPL]|uniref:histidine kinase n=1 Tax=Methylophaga lonarensis MPL TaxID=1286106 RepID=M7PPA0_9GAMM|nr:ATP-binding protein [Methylophaga lonarensis]EMR12264.1 Osmosensitive K+ channel histidine kinase KdpD [Methylophaga lonarensis MPL]